jgi:hypothetical protein
VRPGLTAKVWCEGEAEPPDGKTSNLTSHPPSWFSSEFPDKAAELFVLEVTKFTECPRKLTVNVRDENGALYRYHCEAFLTIDVRVRAEPPAGEKDLAK